MTTKLTPGVHPNVKTFHLSDEQDLIMRRFSLEWFVTYGGSKINLANSYYQFFLMKPTENYQELFNLEREVIVGFSDYAAFEPRALDLFDYVTNTLSELRVEKVCGVLVSRDQEVSTKIRELLKNDAEYQVVIPFHYDELLSNKNDSHFIRNRFREHFYSRDLFAFQSPLKKELYFFGRSDLVHQIVNRHRSGENSGLFGLRKTGKTSVVFGIRRAIESTGGAAIYIDCQSPALHKKRWNQALSYVIEQAEPTVKERSRLKPESGYCEAEATASFENDLRVIADRTGRRILLVFDEIEQITPGVSPTDHWRNGSDFVFFWQSLRSLFQKHDRLFTYLIVGTNPKCVETPLINGIDNPIFNQVPREYVPAFDVPQTREMVRKLGRFMGLKFDEIVYGKLNEDFGGHPFLIRNVCSTINKLVGGDRPVRVDKGLYAKGKEVFLKEHQSYLEMILSVLKQYYPDEYEMLRMLAVEDIETFAEFAELSREYTNHLAGYNIIDENKGNFSFQIDAVKQYLIATHKYTKLRLSKKDVLAEISERRNDLEPKLRNIVRQILTARYGEGEAKEVVARIISKTKPKYAALSLRDILDPKKSEIYFEDLRKIISKEWESFHNIFGADLDRFNSSMKAVNKYRADAHSSELTPEELSHFRVSIEYLEKATSTYL